MSSSATARSTTALAARPFVGDVAIRDDRIVYVGPRTLGRGRIEIDASGKAVAPGFINMLSWATESLIADGRGLSDLAQGVTLEVMGEGLLHGPWSPAMKGDGARAAGQHQVRHHLDHARRVPDQPREARAIAPTSPSYVGRGNRPHPRAGEGRRRPHPRPADQMRGLVAAAMEDGAMGVGSSLIYAPGTYAETPELIALATEAGRCGGGYISHLRYESDRLLEGVDELITIARASAPRPRSTTSRRPAEQLAQDRAGDRQGRGRARRGPARHRRHVHLHRRLDGAGRRHAALGAGGRARGLDQTPAGPRVRARVIAEMRDPAPKWENLYRHAARKARCWSASRPTRSSR
jgi:N-acyl-D-amino-acid deacylase